MDPLQFSLFFAALLVGYVLVHLRMARFEKYLREVSGIKTLNERLQGVADALERIRVEPHEELLQEIRDEMKGLRGDVRRVEQASREIGERDATGPVVIPGAQPSVGESLRNLVEGRLMAMGYADLKILTDLSSARLDSEVDIVVECNKNEMPFKGRVRIRNGSIQGVEMQSVAASFP